MYQASHAPCAMRRKLPRRLALRQVAPLEIQHSLKLPSHTQLTLIHPPSLYPHFQSVKGVDRALAGSSCEGPRDDIRQGLVARCLSDRRRRCLGLGLLMGRSVARKTNGWAGRSRSDGRKIQAATHCRERSEGPPPTSPAVLLPFAGGRFIIR